MSEINVNQLLGQMRAMSVEAGGKAAPADNSGDFAAMLKQSIDSVNETQVTSSNLSRDFEIGKSDVSLAQVMIASQKANVSFQAMVQVRNKLVDAYQSVMNMPM
ncbi:MAG: flagellar hook-basal body complex protein FliE [Methylomonas sp.]|jgi:flagellar hook-basal body complex protein FliE